MLVSTFNLTIFLLILGFFVLLSITSLYFLYKVFKVFSNIENNSEASIEIIDYHYDKMLGIIDNSQFLIDEPVIQEFLKEFVVLKGELRSQVSELFLSKDQIEVEIQE